MIDLTTRARVEHRFLVVLVCVSMAGSALAQRTAPGFEEDVRVACAEIDKQCAALTTSKKIDWKKVTEVFVKEARSIKSNEQHLVLLTRLLARLRDGHAEVRPTEKARGVKWPDDEKGVRTGPGLFLCRIGAGVFVKNSFGTARSAGILPGAEIVKIGGSPAQKWIDARVATLSDRIGFSTDHQALFYAMHSGLEEPIGTRIEYEIKDPSGAVKRPTVTFSRATTVPDGPAYPPKDLTGTDDVRHGKTAKGYGYIHVRRCRADLPEAMDGALLALAAVPGLILDFRGNSGGGFDHEAFMGRFVPKGTTISFGNKYASAGPSPYGGPIVVIVDATVRSAGETGSGIFKEDGRAYMIGESPTAGMASQKTTIELPSGLFSLYVSTGSNKLRFNGGRGIEGVGVIPHEQVAFTAKDLAAEVDTLIRRAEELLADFPQKAVPYDHKKALR